ncbi:helicase-related protein [Sphingomonas sp.]|uniref:helicase-related protein n=1 Tax=Sphingomonas sp. TaxID=28214 RepID=UPI002C9A1B29|nr:helicase-related protein [Sphingomonas sp.]HWK37182.1 helicase-related protein [Sphingomonas sp.]
MVSFARSPITAVLGPTNTGKTHLAVERMCGHSSGMIGFPLRLLAREVYDRVVRMKGEHQVALITGEERIVPPQARWFLCTAESMPLDREFGFVALDEAQLGADLERGHVFTDRILRARGRDETMILGSAALKTMLKSLVPDAEVIERPRFSTLSYAGAKKLSRLPKRSAIVAFSAEEVYAVAEALRRLRGGAAVVMGALSPRTRNAQVAMFQAGEVDYLVATDAIGMGLNMDVAHVAFASLTKFDGRRQRRLTVAEMAQIAGRAGRHQRDGTFGALHEQGPGAFTPEEVFAIEEHRFAPIDHLYWRDGEPDLSSIAALIASLEAKPTLPGLRPAPEATDLAVLKRLAEDPAVRQRGQVAKLWAACGLPDFRKLGPEPHSRFVGRIFNHLTEGDGHIPHRWFAEEIARLDNVGGDVETIAGRIAAARSWAYIAHRADWLSDPLHWQDRAQALETRLSDALHDRLTQRFVDKRTTALLRGIGADASALPVKIEADGGVLVEDHPIGRLDGFRFTVAADARAADKRILLAAAEKRLGGELAKRGRALADAPDDALTLDGGSVCWSGGAVATLAAGPQLSRPKIVLDRALDCLGQAERDAIAARLAAWIDDRTAQVTPVLARLDRLARDPTAPGALRATAAALADAGGLAERNAVADVEGLEPKARQYLRAVGITVGTLDLFDPRLLKPAAAAWRAALLAARGVTVALPPPGAAVIRGGAPAPGFRRIGAQQVRVDLVERIARAAHDARAGRKPFVPDPALATSIGVTPDTLAKLMARLGFKSVAAEEGPPQWAWRGRPQPRARVTEAPPRRDNAFAALADWGTDRSAGHG